MDGKKLKVLRAFIDADKGATLSEGDTFTCGYGLASYLTACGYAEEVKEAPKVEPKTTTAKKVTSTTRKAK